MDKIKLFEKVILLGFLIFGMSLFIEGSIGFLIFLLSQVFVIGGQAKKYSLEAKNSKIFN
ncbi:hypothetical protein ACOAKC_10225 [Hathewaya histolytica]|uniref:hypothetical protein n=1 Tax=Hathewaya histolytica TaxID=1498 RepID=UPI003B67DEBB